LPTFIVELIGSSGFSAQSLNLLVDDYRPQPIRSAQRRLGFQIIFLLILVAAAIVIGLERRTARLVRQASQLQTARLAMYGDVLDASNSNQPPEIRLVAELRRLRQTRQQPVGDLQIEDCTPLLADLLSHWPDDVFMQAESISVTPTTISVRGTAPASDDVQRFADAVKQFRAQSWRLEQPQVNAGRDAVQAHCNGQGSRLLRSGGAP